VLSAREGLDLILRPARPRSRCSGSIWIPIAIMFVQR
jgi:hypothetical protein